MTHVKEQKVIGEIFAMKGRGMSLRAIASELNEEGTPAKNGGAWYHSSIQYILSNPLYKK